MRIINNLLFFSRIKNPRYQATEIHALIDECLETIGLRFKDRITVRKRVDAVRGVKIEADPVQLQEVFTNLFNNAHDALGEEGGCIEISASHDPASVVVRISDDGVGIDEKDLERVFEPFFTTKTKGTGLGLAVCRQIIALHGGTIGIESALGRGTTVTVALPKKILTG